MDEIESLCRLCEAVETAGADIAPTYAEGVSGDVFEDVLGIGEVTRGAFVGIRKSINIRQNCPDKRIIT